MKYLLKWFTSEQDEDVYVIIIMKLDVRAITQFESL